jgi:hypothetical protein
MVETMLICMTVRPEDLSDPQFPIADLPLKETHHMRLPIPLLMLALTVALATPAAAQHGLAREGFALTLRSELGFIAPLYHRIQYSEAGTYFDYVGEGGQNVLFPYSRWTAEMRLGGRHHVGFLFQPLTLETEVRLNRDIVVDDAIFPEGRPVELLYNFPYYRTTYLYDLIDDPRREFSIGGGLQIRNATISFQTADGELRRDRRDVGFVPLLKVRAHQPLGREWFAGGEAAGFYAPVRYLNIRDVDVVGAILDANLLVGRRVDRHVDALLTIRYVGGGSEGTSNRRPEEPGDGFTRNWLHAMSVALGFTYRF